MNKYIKAFYIISLLFFLVACTSNQKSKQKDSVNMERKEMDEKKFWDIIKQSRQANVFENKQIELIEDKLANCSASEIVDFQKILSQLFSKAFKKEGVHAAYFIITANQLSTGDWYAGDESFVSFILCLVCLGEQVYYEVLENPDNIINYLDNIDYDMELLIEVINDVYYEKTGEYLLFINEENNGGILYSEIISKNSSELRQIKATCPNLWAKIMLPKERK